MVGSDDGGLPSGESTLQLIRRTAVLNLSTAGNVVLQKSKQYTPTLLSSFRTIQSFTINIKNSVFQIDEKQVCASHHCHLYM